MNEFLKPSSDNLYKYLVIFGFGLLFSSIVVAGKEIVLLNDRYEELREARQQEYAAYGSAVAQHAVSQVIPKFTADQDKARVQENLVREGAGAQAVYKAAQERRESASLQADQQFAESKRALLLATVIAFTGISVSTLGFLAWYFRLQRYQDRLLRLQLAEAMRAHPELDASGAASKKNGVPASPPTAPPSKATSPRVPTT